MSGTRTLLVWLCCALVLGIGVPLRAKAPCEPAPGRPAAPAAPSCCGTADCHCADMVLADGCDCSGSRAPAPKAPAPSPQKLQVPDAGTMPRRQEVPPLAPPKVEPRGGDAPRACAIPSRSRMEVFSVWRC